MPLRILLHRPREPIEWRLIGRKCFDQQILLFLGNGNHKTQSFSIDFVDRFLFHPISPNLKPPEHPTIDGSSGGQFRIIRPKTARICMFYTKTTVYIRLFCYSLVKIEPKNMHIPRTIFYLIQQSNRCSALPDQIQKALIRQSK